MSASALPSTIKHHATFERSLPVGFDGVFDWSWTQGHLGQGKITPMDFDGVVERKGNFIVFETKGAHVPIPQGQLMTLEAAYRLGVFTVLLVQGKTAPEAAQAWCQPGFLNGLRMTRHAPTDSNRLGIFVGKWYDFANANPARQNTSSALAIVHTLKMQLQEIHAQNALLLREYLIEKSGRFMDDGWDKNDADNEAAWIAAEKFGASLELCFGILSRVQ